MSSLALPADRARDPRRLLPVRIRVASWSRAAWIAIGATAASVGLTCWWLSQNRAMPYGDAAEHLYAAFLFHDALSAGNWLVPLHYVSYYPPFTQTVGALAIFVGGRNVATPVLAQNLVYVPLLALACYRIAQRVHGEAAGALAVVFALGSPLITEQFHVFMIDAPEAALVAVTVWLVLASERFARTDVAALAGLVTGVGLITKETFPLYVGGFVLLVLARGGGWRNRRGITAFAGIAFVVAFPWYLDHLSELGRLGGAALPNPTIPEGATPPLLSAANTAWYAWAIVNGLLFVPLLVLATVGLVTETVALARRRATAYGTPELLGGALLAWLAITFTPHHDMRYTMGLIVFLAVLGTGWIVRSAPAARIAATTALVLAVAASLLGATFGVGGHSSALLPGNRDALHGEGVPPMHRITLYSNHDFLVSGPREGGDVLGLMKALHHDGVTGIAWSDAGAPEWDADFNANGLLLFALIARLHVLAGVVDPESLGASSAILIRQQALGGPPACAQLGDGLGLWVQRGGARVCPGRAPPPF